MARSGNLGASAYLSLLLLLLPAATATSYSSHCDYPVVADDLAEYSFTALLDLPLPFNGYFSGGDKLLFAPDRRLPRSFSFFPRRAANTTNPALLHLFATVTLYGYRDLDRRGGRYHSVSFDLEGYYSTAPASAPAELCMVGSGSRARDDGMGVAILPDVVLRLRLPQPANLRRPFVTGSLEGEDFGPVTLVAYAKGDYAYDETASCPPPPGPVRASHQVLHGNFSCNHLRALLRNSYSLEYGPKGSPSSSSPLRLLHRRMNVNQVHCATDGGVRAYMVFYISQSDGFPLNVSTAQWRHMPHGLEVGDEALVADGSWDSSQSRLCLRACRVVRSAPSEADLLAVRECSVGMQFWFPAVWSIRDRHVVAGLIWNTSRKSDDADADGMSGVISVSRTGNSIRDLSGIKYKYTRVEEAKKYYHSKPELSKEMEGRLPGNYSYHDFDFHFHMTKQRGFGHASPVTLGAILVGGDSLMADDAFSRDVEAVMNSQRLLNVSYEYDLYHYQVDYVNSFANVSDMSTEQWSMSAEGVYDTKAGSLCMVACRSVIKSSSDCQILVTFQFSPIDTKVSKRGAGEISSLRKETDPLFFKALQIVAHGMSLWQVDESVSRMDMEGVMLVISMTLSCVFILLQLRHATKNPQALPAMSITMLVVLSLGYMIPLVLNFEAMFISSKHYVKLASGGWLELNELALRVSTMVAFVLQLRLLQLAWSGRSAEDETWAAERSSLWICLPLYLIGGVLVWIVHMSDGHVHSIEAKFATNARRSALSDDLVSYAGLILDGFLLPQVISNAFSGSRVKAISPWFYLGNTMIRATPHVYDMLRARSFVPTLRPSNVYASHGDDLFSAAWDVVVPCGVAVLAVLLFLQQRLGGVFLCCLKSRKSGEYEMVSTLSS